MERNPKKSLIPTNIYLPPYIRYTLPARNNSDCEGLCCAIYFICPGSCLIVLRAISKCKCAMFPLAVSLCSNTMLPVYFAPSAGYEGEPQVHSIHF